MTRARYTQISLDSTSYYHCICRCVRRAFLCGRDHYSGQDYEHRRQWVVDRLAVLGEVFAIDLCAYAVMANHYHVVVRINEKQASGWGDTEVAERWMQLFRGPEVVKRWLSGQTEGGETLKALEIIGLWRERLYDLGWFMKCLNEYLARRANEEDCCKGRFWEGRCCSAWRMWILTLSGQRWRRRRRNLTIPPFSSARARSTALASRARHRGYCRWWMIRMLRPMIMKRFVGSD